jgi:hypothetical protein
MLVINAPPMLSSLKMFLKPFVKPETIAKIDIYVKDKWTGTIQDIIRPT